MLPSATARLFFRLEIFSKIENLRNFQISRSSRVSSFSFKRFIGLLYNSLQVELLCLSKPIVDLVYLTIDLIELHWIIVELFLLSDRLKQLSLELNLFDVAEII